MVRDADVALHRLAAQSVRISSRNFIGSGGRLVAYLCAALRSTGGSTWPRETIAMSDSRTVLLPERIGAAAICSNDRKAPVMRRATRSVPASIMPAGTTAFCCAS